MENFNHGGHIAVNCPNCHSDNCLDRTDIYKEPRTSVYNYLCEDCNCLFNDEEDFVAL